MSNMMSVPCVRPGLVRKFAHALCLNALNSPYPLERSHVSRLVSRYVAFDRFSKGSEQLQSIENEHEKQQLFNKKRREKYADTKLSSQVGLYNTIWFLILSSTL